MDHQALTIAPLFEGLSDDELQSCAEHFTTVRVLAGEELTHEEDFGYSFFVVLDGHVRVNAGDQVLAELGPGDHFGEVALVTGERRNATVKAVTAGVLAKMMTWDFQDVVSKNPRLAARLQAIVDERKPS